MSFVRSSVRRAIALVLVGFAVTGRADGPIDGTVLIADEACSLEEVMEQILVKQHPTRVTKFWVVITGDQVKLATKANGMSDRVLAKGFDLVRQYGGIIYACEVDMQRLGLTAGDLLPPTEPLRGFGVDGTTDTDSVLYSDEDPELLPESVTQLRRLRAACSGRG
jgi:hypothetical protein